jgi:hypothetical protein
MKTIDLRIGKLDHQFGTAAGKPQYLLAVCRAGWGLAVDQDTCIQILGECGFLPTGPGRPREPRPDPAWPECGGGVIEFSGRVSALARQASSTAEPRIAEATLIRARRRCIAEI